MREKYSESLNAHDDESLKHTPFQSQDIKSAQDIEKEIVQPCVYYCSITDPLGTKCKISRAPLGKLEKVLVS